MKLLRRPIIVVEESDANQFEKECKKLYEDGYRIVSSSCGFMDSDEHNYASVFQAIFQDSRIIS